MPSDRKISAHHFCLWYAVGCLDSNHVHGKISKEDYDAVLECARADKAPPGELMRRCFPKVYERLGKTEPTLREMIRYWRNRHHAGENTPVCLGVVKKKTGGTPHGELWNVRFWDPNTRRTQTRAFFNTLGLQVDEGHRVFVHGTTIAEFAPAED